MIDRDALADLLIRHEGRRIFVYDDATGKPLKTGDTIQGIPTVGVGRNLMDVGISEEESTYLLMNDIERAIVASKKLTPDFESLGVVRQMVLVDMAFNMGPKRLAGFKKMLAAISRQDFEDAAEEMLDSKWARQVGRRADALAGMMRSGELPEE